MYWGSVALYGVGFGAAYLSVPVARAVESREVISVMGLRILNVQQGMSNVAGSNSCLVRKKSGQVSVRSER